MKYIILSTIVLFSSSTVTTQSTFIELNDLDIIGVIFDAKYEPHFVFEEITDRFTPSVTDLERAEILVSKFDLRNRKSIKKARRQYLGFEKNNNRYLLVHVMFYECEKQFSSDFPDWKTTFAYLFTEPDDIQKSFLYLVNLDDGTIGFY